MYVKEITKNIDQNLFSNPIIKMFASTCAQLLISMIINSSSNRPFVVNIIIAIVHLAIATNTTKCT